MFGVRLVPLGSLVVSPVEVLSGYSYAIPNRHSNSKQTPIRPSLELWRRGPTEIEPVTLGLRCCLDNCFVNYPRTPANSYFATSTHSVNSNRIAVTQDALAGRVSISCDLAGQTLAIQNERSFFLSFSYDLAGGKFARGRFHRRSQQPCPSGRRLCHLLWEQIRPTGSRWECIRRCWP